ncbi:hypothetical protein [Alkalibacterium gilvum]|uniref:hypothetical protein n=1 Tax=Alkalibacterium gilvum TaxID=1130080 RepID=UPI000B82D5D5|nr:hypothetical protein [Alkalibacterium gilvum]
MPFQLNSSDSKFQIDKGSFKTKGIAITSKTNLKSAEELLNISIQITEGDKDKISNLPKVEIV